MVGEEVGDERRGFPHILLVLGSFDPETKKILYRVREHVARTVPAMPTHIFLTRSGYSKPGILTENV